MQIDKEVKKNLIAGILPMLKENVMEATTKMERITGAELTRRGGRLENGKEADPYELYMLEVPTSVRVNHRRRLLSIIDQSKDMDQLTDRLAAYQRKYGKAAPSAIKASPLNNQKNKRP